jgi:hypothetical protein
MRYYRPRVPAIFLHNVPPQDTLRRVHSLRLYPETVNKWDASVVRICTRIEASTHIIQRQIS